MRTAALAAALLALVLGGCGGGPDDSDLPRAEPSPPPTATPVPWPDAEACYRLDYTEALAPTVESEPVGCRRRHTSQTFAVGSLDALTHGHLLAVDSRRVREQVAKTCPRRLAHYLGGSSAQQRLSVLRAVWFTPTVEESDSGASWYRCDLIAVAGNHRLARLGDKVRGALSTPSGRDRYGVCGTARPDARDFEQVPCSRRHTWRAVAVVAFPGATYPGRTRARSRGSGPCEAAGRSVASDALDFQWGYVAPTRAQWRAGQHYGLCWAPDRSG